MSAMLALNPAAGARTSFVSGLPTSVRYRSRLPVLMGFFDGIKANFGNDDSLGSRQNAGLSRPADTRTITWVGPGGTKVSEGVTAGQSLQDIARRARVPIKYSCKDGWCKTCEVEINGRRVSACQAGAPNSDVTIKWFKDNKMREDPRKKGKGGTAASRMRKKMLEQDISSKKSGWSWR